MLARGVRNDFPVNKPESGTVEGSGDQAALESLAEISAEKEEAPAVAAPIRDDQALVEAASAGDHRAFESLVSKYERRIFAVALQLTRNGDLAQELTQEVFVRAWKALPRFQGGASFYTWVYRILKNLNINHHHHNKQQTNSEFNDEIN